MRWADDRRDIWIQIHVVCDWKGAHFVTEPVGLVMKPIVQ